MWQRLAHVLARRPLLVLGVAVIVMASLATGLSKLEFRTDQATLVDAQSQVYKDNARYQQEFGGDNMLVLISGDPVDLFSAQNAPVLQQLESELRSIPGIATVVGPTAAVEFAAAQVGVAPALLTNAIPRAPDQAAFLSRVGVEAQRLAAAGEQSLSNLDFVRFAIFADDGSVRPSMRSAFPDATHALIVAQIAGDASIDEQGRISHDVKAAVDRHPIAGHTILATGTPVLLDEINSYLQGGMTTLGLIAVAVMIVVLWFAFRVRWRLLPLVVMAIGTASALGAAVLAGIDLSFVTISGLPIFIGLGVDFAIQIQNRYAEQRSRGDDPQAAVAATLGHMGTPLIVAMVAGFAGFVALRLSSVPMIKDFGLLLCLGVVVLVCTAIVLPLAILVLVDARAHRAPSTHARRSALERAIGKVTTLPRTAVGIAVVVGVVVAAIGFAAEGGMPIQTEAEKWVNPNGTAVKELHELRATTGFSDQLGLEVVADDATSDAVVAWIYQFETVEQRRHPGQLLEAASLPEIAGDVLGLAPTGNDVRALLAVAPHDVSASLMTADHKTTNVVFPVGDISLAQKQALIASIEADLRGDLAPPAGVKVTPAGIAVIGIELVKGLEANRRTLTLAALALVALWLLVRGRLRVRSLLPLVPVAIAVGASLFVIRALGLELTPLTTVAAPLVIAVATEFTVLLEARYLEERRNGCTPLEACASLPHIGRAFVASGLTLVGGFGVMAASPMTLLRDFGTVVALDVVIALVCALVIMPPLLRWADRDVRVEAETHSDVDLTLLKHPVSTS